MQLGFAAHGGGLRREEEQVSVLRERPLEAEMSCGGKEQLEVLGLKPSKAILLFIDAAPPPRVWLELMRISG